MPINKLKMHNEETKLIYQRKNIPMYLIAYGNNESEAKEIVSGKKLHCKYSSALGIRETTKNEAEKYFNENDYYNKVTNYFKQIYKSKLSNMKFNLEPFAETYQVEAYLDGKLDGEPFNGEFTGTLKLIKKIN